VWLRYSEILALLRELDQSGLASEETIK